MSMHDDRYYRNPVSGLPQQVPNNIHNNYDKQRQPILSQTGDADRLGAIGLMPSDGQDAYKRTQNRASRRSRAQRTSYLVATGHLDPEETKRLNANSSDSIELTTQHLIPSAAPINRVNSIPEKHKISDETNKRSSNNTSAGKRSNFQQSFLDDLNRTLANSPPVNPTTQHVQQIYEFKRENKLQRKDSRKKYKKQTKLHSNSSSRLGNKDDFADDPDDGDRPTFRQTYTQVSFPMKTSPAFEYILKDNERRNKRCCLWFLYSTLLTVCIAIIIFCSVHLILRNHLSIR